MKLGERYKIVEKIGDGAMASVFKLKDTELDATLAIKIMTPRLSEDDLAIKRFQQEAVATQGLNHPNIINVYLHDVSPAGVHYMVMDYCKGVTLLDMLERAGPLDLDLFLDIVTQICNGLIHAHSRGVIHRDIKPNNVVIGQNEDGEIELKIVDFGIAKLIKPVSDEMQVQTKEGKTVGSPFFMSPEQLQGHGVDARSDIYSLGCVMFQAISGRYPFYDKSAIKIAMKHIKETPPKLMEITDGRCTLALERIVEKCLEKDPDSRYQNVFDLRADLQRLSKGLEPSLDAGNALGDRKYYPDIDLLDLNSNNEIGLTRAFDGRLSYELRMDVVLTRVLDLGYEGDSLLRLKSDQPDFKGIIAIRGGGCVIGALIVNDSTSGIGALRRLLSLADAEFEYVTIDEDHANLPDSSMRLDLREIVKAYPALPVEQVHAMDEEAVRDLVMYVTSTEVTAVTDRQLYMTEDSGENQSDGLDPWKPVEEPLYDTSTVSYFDGAIDIGKLKYQARTEDPGNRDAEAAPSSRRGFLKLLPVWPRSNK